MATINNAPAPAFVATVASKRHHVAARYIALNIFKRIARNRAAAVMRYAARIANHIIGRRFPMLRNFCKVTFGVAVVLVGHNLFFPSVSVSIGLKIKFKFLRPIRPGARLRNLFLWLRS